jgi:hypothetical protein
MLSNPAAFKSRIRVGIVGCRRSRSYAETMVAGRLLGSTVTMTRAGRPHATRAALRFALTLITKAS